MEGGAGSSSSSASEQQQQQRGEFADGCKLQIKTSFGEAIEGHVLAYDKASSILVLHILSFPYWNRLRIRVWRSELAVLGNFFKPSVKSPTFLAITILSSLRASQEFAVRVYRSANELPRNFLRFINSMQEQAITF